MLLSEMPSFLNDQLGYDLESSGLLSIAPYAANLLSVAMFAQIYDHLEVGYSSSISPHYSSRKKEDGPLAKFAKMLIKLLSLDQVLHLSSVDFWQILELHSPLLSFHFSFLERHNLD